MYSPLDAESDKKAQELWAAQYPYGGFCFGPDKPTVHLVQDQGKQVIRFEGSALNGEIRQCLYPNFSFSDWTDFVYDTMGTDWIARLGIDDNSPQVRQCAHLVTKALIDKRATGEIDFWNWFQDRLTVAQTGYTNDVWDAPTWIPAIIPQVWIQWHSETLPDLRTWGSPYASQPQRIDFAVFWNNRRHAVLIDGIQHYAKKRNNVWEASEEQYSNRLAEDRFLRLNAWEVFRVSNWELRDPERRAIAMQDFEKQIGFEF